MIFYTQTSINILATFNYTNLEVIRQSSPAPSPYLVIKYYVNTS